MRGTRARRRRARRANPPRALHRVRQYDDAIGASIMSNDKMLTVEFAGTGLSSRVRVTSARD